MYNLKLEIINNDILKIKSELNRLNFEMYENIVNYQNATNKKEEEIHITKIKILKYTSKLISDTFEIKLIEHENYLKNSNIQENIKKVMLSKVIDSYDHLMSIDDITTFSDDIIRDITTSKNNNIETEENYKSIFIENN